MAKKDEKPASKIRARLKKTHQARSRKGDLTRDYQQHQFQDEDTEDREQVSGKGEFINGTRLVYPMENQAMRILNYLANHLFSLIFSWILNQRFTDTLCGTKVLTKANYEKIAAGRGYFGEFDPFGDFDLIFGAVKQNLKVVELPIRYADRTYGETQISRFRHGLLLIRMVIFAFRKLKAV